MMEVPSIDMADVVTILSSTLVPCCRSQQRGPRACVKIADHVVIGLNLSNWVRNKIQVHCTEE